MRARHQPVVHPPAAAACRPYDARVTHEQRAPHMPHAPRQDAQRSLVSAQLQHIHGKHVRIPARPTRGMRITPKKAHARRRPFRPPSDRRARRQPVYSIRYMQYLSPRAPPAPFALTTPKRAWRRRGALTRRQDARARARCHPGIQFTYLVLSISMQRPIQYNTYNTARIPARPSRGVRITTGSRTFKGPPDARRSTL